MLSSVAQAQDTSTPEERQQWADVAHKLEANPLDQDLSKQGEVALQQVMNAHDFHVVLCAGLFHDFQSMSYKHQHVILRQYLLGTAAYQVANPDASGDATRVNVAGVESALRVYGAILAQTPHDKSKMLDRLLDEQKNGKLAADVQGKCK